MWKIEDLEHTKFWVQDLVVIKITQQITQIRMKIQTMTKNKIWKVNSSEDYSESELQLTFSRKNNPKPFFAQTRPELSSKACDQNQLQLQSEIQHLESENSNPPSTSGNNNIIKPTATVKSAEYEKLIENQIPRPIVKWVYLYNSHFNICGRAVERSWFKCAESPDHQHFGHWIDLPSKNVKQTLIELNGEILKPQSSTKIFKWITTFSNVTEYKIK